MARWVLGPCMLAFALLAACSPSKPDTLVVFVAASCTQVAQDLAAAQPGLRIQNQFASTAALARQIQDGAPANIFLSASTAWKDALVQSDRVAGDPIRFATGRLVCIAREGDHAALEWSNNLQTLPQALAAGERVAIADNAVPAGQYARQALANSESEALWEPYLVGLPDVRGVYRAVQSGQARLGFVYATDSVLPGVVPLFAIDPELHDPIEFWAIPIRQAGTATAETPSNTPGGDALRASPQTGTYLKFLVSEPGRSILGSHSFE